MKYIFLILLSISFLVGEENLRNEEKNQSILMCKIPLVIKSENKIISISMIDMLKWTGIVIAIFLSIVIAIYVSNIRLKKEIRQRRKLQKEASKHLDIIDKHVLILSTDLNGIITEVSSEFCNKSGYTKKELIGSSHTIIRSPDVSKELYKKLWKTIIEDKVWIGEIKNVSKDGNIFWEDISISPRYDFEGKKIGYTSIRQDITDKKNIEEISKKDGLTNIYNRRYFDETIVKVINREKRDNGKISFLLIDLDYFKQYNDTYGHQMGDEVLIKVASRLKETLHRADDDCFRLGGEEFGVLYTGLEHEKSLEFANKLKKRIEDLKIIHLGNKVSSYVTASFGLVCIDAKDINSVDEIYKQVDALLYQAKAKGRNQVVSNM